MNVPFCAFEWQMPMSASGIGTGWQSGLESKGRSSWSTSTMNNQMDQQTPQPNIVVLLEYPECRARRSRIHGANRPPYPSHNLI